MDFSFSLDRYDLGARLAPALLAISPAAILAAAWAPEFWSLLTGLSAFLLVGGSFFLMGVARSRGLEVEKEYEAALKQRPSILALRHGHEFQRANRDRYHRIFRDLKIELPTAEEQKLSIAVADAQYAEAIEQLISWTDDHEKFPLVHNENISYGFARNLRGLKPIAIGILVVCLLIDGVLLFGAIQSGSDSVATAAAIAAVFVVFLLAWIFLVTKAAALKASWLYVRRLLAALDKLDPKAEQGGKAAQP